MHCTFYITWISELKELKNLEPIGLIHDNLHVGFQIVMQISHV